MRGNLSPEAFARVLRGLAVSRKEGVLHLHRDSLSKRVHFKGGSIVFAGSDDEQDRLGEVLIRVGKLKRSDLELALSVMAETGESLADTIVEMGIASHAQVAEVAFQRTRSIIASVFSWPSGTFAFEERAVDLQGEMGLQLSATEVILAGITGHENLELVRRGLGDLNAVLRRPATPLLLEEKRASASFAWLLERANGVSIAEIVAASTRDESTTLRSIHALVLAGILEIEERERSTMASAESTRVQMTQGPTGTAVLSRQALPTVLGRYEVEKLLGRGAMGAVYLAKDPAIDRTIAVKLIQTAVQLTPPEFEKYRERFYREAKAAGKLLHPGIVTVFDVGHTDEATPFIVMEFVQGETLQHILKTKKLGLEEVLDLAVKILEPLAYAHSHGVVHRDIKPENILVTKDGGVKVMDFGIAHVVGSELTQADDVLGSPNYMAPEQLSKGTIDARTDLFAFGVVLYRMLTGKLPFQGDSFAAIAKAVLFDQPPPPERIDPSIPASLSRVVSRCLDKDPAGRFESAGELMNALRLGFAGLDVPDVLEPPSAAASGRSAASRSRLETRSRTKGGVPAAGWLQRANGKLLLAMGAVAFVVAAFLVAFAPWRPSEAENPSASAAMLSQELQERSADPTVPFVPLDLEVPEDPVETEPPEPSDAELYHEASIAFERGDRIGSKEALEKLLRRNPGFEGAPELLVRVNQSIRDEQREGTSTTAAPPMPAPPSPSPTPVPTDPAPVPTEAQLLYYATLAYQNGDLEGSKRRLEAILQTNPSSQGASQLLATVKDAIWKKTLPLSFEARHNHRIGGCTGTLILENWGVRYSSHEHDWRWKFEEVRLMEKGGRNTINIETRDSDVLNLGKTKNYKFELLVPMRDEDWSRYRALAR